MSTGHAVYELISCLTLASVRKSPSSLFFTISYCSRILACVPIEIASVPLPSALCTQWQYR